MVSPIDSKTLAKAYTGPFPGHLRPSADECRGVKAALERLHGPVKRVGKLDYSLQLQLKDESISPSSMSQLVKEDVKIEVGVDPDNASPMPLVEDLETSRSEKQVLAEVSNVKLELADSVYEPATPSQGPCKRRKVKQENTDGEVKQERGLKEGLKELPNSTSLETPHRVLRSATRKYEAEPMSANAALALSFSAPTTPEPQAAASQDAPVHRSVLDSLVRTILSQNTTDKNSSRAFASLKQTFPAWEDARAAGQAPLAESIKCGGLAEIKARRILDILESLAAKRGILDLEHLRFMSDDEVKAELSQFKGVGPKTVACVLMFCLDRHEFPVDTHVWRISKRLGWVPPNADREATYMHLNQRVPDDVKYDLHCLLVGHGKGCPQCAKGGRPQKAPDGPCPLTPWIRGTSKAEKQ